MSIRLLLEVNQRFIRDLLTEHGFAGVSEKSFKASGVSALLDKKTSLSDVQVILIVLPFPFYSDSKFPKSRFMEDGKPHKQCYIIMILQSQEGKKSRMFYLPNNLFQDMAIYITTILYTSSSNPIR